MRNLREDSADSSRALRSLIENIHEVYKIKPDDVKIIRVYLLKEC